MSEQFTWGWHSSFDASFCNLEKITDEKNVYNFIKRLVIDIDMEAYGEPEIVNFGHGDKAGLTCQQLITTSNICGHFSNELKSAFIDVFSCKPFDASVVETLIKDYFEAGMIEIRIQTRTCYF